jgi:hypothetical protein
MSEPLGVSSPRIPSQRTSKDSQTLLCEFQSIRDQLLLGLILILAGPPRVLNDSETLRARPMKAIRRYASFKKGRGN